MGKWHMKKKKEFLVIILFLALSSTFGLNIHAVQAEEGDMEIACETEEVMENRISEMGTDVDDYFILSCALQYWSQLCYCSQIPANEFDPQWGTPSEQCENWAATKLNKCLHPKPIGGGGVGSKPFQERNEEYLIDNVGWPPPA
jgi:hypothetical protein